MNLVIQRNFADRLLGGLLIIAGLVMVFAMLHHPVVNAGTPEAAFAEITHEAPINRLVHGGAIIIAILQLYGFMVIYERANVGTGPHLSILFFGIGTAAMVGAATISGFVVPLLASYYGVGEITGFTGLNRMAFAGNQALAGLGSLAWAIAALTSAFSFWRAGLRIIAGIGGLAGLITLLLAVTSSGIDVLTMTVIALGISLWSAAMGGWLLITDSTRAD